MWWKQSGSCSSDSVIKYSTSICCHFSKIFVLFPLQPSHLSPSDTFGDTQVNTRSHGSAKSLLRGSADLCLSSEQLSLPLILLILPHCDSHGALSTEAPWTARHDLNRPAARCRGRLGKRIHILVRTIKKKKLPKSSTFENRASCRAELHSHRECLLNSSAPLWPKFTPSVYLPQTMLPALHSVCVWLCVFVRKRASNKTPKIKCFDHWMRNPFKFR